MYFYFYAAINYSLRFAINTMNTGLTWLSILPLEPIGASAWHIDYQLEAIESGGRNQHITRRVGFSWEPIGGHWRLWYASAYNKLSGLTIGGQWRCESAYQHIKLSYMLTFGRWRYESAFTNGAHRRPLEDWRWMLEAAHYNVEFWKQW